MLYNKNNVRKTNDKKILHKVGKQWKVISVALLMAIGGGAVATHAANAQSTNASTQALVNSLEAPAPVQKATVAPSSAASSSANSASAKPASSSSVSYVTNNGSLTSGASAASYRDKALNDKSVAASNGNIANGYIKSLNAKFGPTTALLNGRTASASAKAQSNASLANSYSVVAKNSDNLSVVSELASKSGLTTPDFVSIVQNEANYYSNSVSAASASANALNLVTSAANQVMGANWADINAEAQANSAVASADLSVANAQADNGAESNAQSALSANNTLLAKNQVDSIEASGQYAGAVAASANDASTVNSFAKSASLDANLVSSEVQSYAKNVGSNASYSFTSGSTRISTTELNTVISNAAVKSAAGSVRASVNSAIASLKAAKPQLATNLASAKSAADANSTLLSSATAKSTVASVVAHLTSAAANAMSGSDKSAGALNLLNSADQYESYLKANLDKTNAYEDNDLASLASTEGFDVPALLADRSDASAIKGIANDLKNSMVNATDIENEAKAAAKSAATSAVNANTELSQEVTGVAQVAYNNARVEGQNDAQAKATASNSATNFIETNSVVVSIANSAADNVINANKSSLLNNLSAAYSGVSSNVATNLSNATSASASYANATDENVTLASYFASSYSTEASSNASVASSYADFANTFYVTQIHNSEFTSANAAARAAAAAEPNDAALANAAGQRVWNYAPKYITVTKAAGLYSNPNYQGAKRFGFAQVGDQLTVTGVGISENGTVHYAVSYKGNNAYITAQPNYVEPTYLQNQGNLSVTTLQGVRVFSDAARTNATGDMVDANTKLDNVHVVSVDNVYGGYTTLETPSGNFITANVKCVKVNVNANNNNAANSSANNNNNVKPANHVNFWA